MENQVFTLDEICRLNNEDPAQLGIDIRNDLHYQMEQMNSQLNKIIINQEITEDMLDHCLKSNSHSQHIEQKQFSPNTLEQEQQSKLINFAEKILNICQEDGIFNKLPKQLNLLSPKYTIQQAKLQQHLPQNKEIIMDDSLVLAKSAFQDLHVQFHNIEDKVNSYDSLIKSDSTDQLEQFRLSQTNLSMQQQIQQQLDNIQKKPQDQISIIKKEDSLIHYHKPQIQSDDTIYTSNLQKQEIGNQQMKKQKLFKIQPSEFNLQKIFQNHGISSTQKQQNQQLFTAFEFVRSRSKDKSFISNQAEGNLVQARALSRINEKKYNKDINSLRVDLQEMRDKQVQDMLLKRRKVYSK